MASVNELIALAEHEARVSNPAASAIQSALLGFNQAQNQGLDRAIKLIQLENYRQEQENQKKMAEAIARQFGQAQEADVKGKVNAAGVKSQPVIPKQKLEMSIEQDEKGRYSRKFKIVEPKTSTYQKAEYKDAAGVNRIGKFDTNTGNIIRSPDDPLSSDQEGDRTAETPQQKAAREVHQSYLKAIQDGTLTETLKRNMEAAAPILNLEQVIVPGEERRSFFGFKTKNPDTTYFKPKGTTPDSELRDIALRELRTLGYNESDLQNENLINAAIDQLRTKSKKKK